MSLLVPSVTEIQLCHVRHLKCVACAFTSTAAGVHRFIACPSWPILRGGAVRYRQRWLDVRRGGNAEPRDFTRPQTTRKSTAGLQSDCWHSENSRPRWGAHAGALFVLTYSVSRAATTPVAVAQCMGFAPANLSSGRQSPSPSTSGYWRVPPSATVVTSTPALRSSGGRYVTQSVAGTLRSAQTTAIR